jgi:hypothetical protein
MAEPHVVSVLKAKRAEIAGEIELIARKLQELRGVLRSLDDTLCLFDQSAVPENIKAKVWRPRPDWAIRGEHARRVLSVLRRANGEGMTTRAITLQIMAERGLDVGRQPYVSDMARRISFTLRCQRDKGLVTSERGSGTWLVWRVIS